MRVIDPPKLDVQEIRAIQALAAGEANAGQQVMALQVIVKKISQPSELMYVPEAPLDTAFMSGRGYVATMLRGVINRTVEEPHREDQ